MIQDIKHQIQKINPDLLSWADEYIAQLPDIFMEDEKIIHIIDGLYNKMVTLLIATDRRVLFKELDMIDMEVIPHEKITSINLWESVIEVRTEENIFRLEKSDRDFAEEFCNTLNTFLISQNTPDVEEPELSVFDLLEQLGQLRENGILTDDEFTEQKKRLLEKL